MINKHELKSLVYTCPECQKQVETFIDTKEFEEKEPPYKITDVHGNPPNRHAATIYVDENFVVRAIEVSDVTTQTTEDESPTTKQQVAEYFIPVPATEKVSMKDLGYLEKSILSRINGTRTSIDIANELNIAHGRVKMILSKLLATKKISELKRMLN